MQEHNENLELDIKKMLQLLLRRAWIIALVTVMISGASFAYARIAVTPQYSASVRMYVNNIYEEDKHGEIEAGQLTAAAYLAEAYMVILSGKPVLNEVLAETGLQDKYTVHQLRSMITSDTINETEIFEVTVTCPDSKDAEVIANAFTRVLPEMLPEIVNGSDVRLVDYAEESKAVVAPDYNQYILIGALVGFVLSVLLVLLREILDDGINSEDYLTTAYSNIPLLAVIPDDRETKNGYYRGYNKKYYKSYYSTQKKSQTGGKKS